MKYAFSSPYNDPMLAEHYTQHLSGLSDEEITRIREYGDTLVTNPLRLYGGQTEEQVKARGSDFLLGDETRWLYERMGALAQRINASNYRYDVTGFHENFYYLQYDAALGEHFNWHLDIGNRTPAPRKLSLVLQLSDPNEYEGGDFDILVPMSHLRTEKKQGIVTAFPSYKIHRVTPVTKGVRRTLSMFLVGPNFK